MLAPAVTGCYFSHKRRGITTWIAYIATAVLTDQHAKETDWVMKWVQGVAGFGMGVRQRIGKDSSGQLARYPGRVHQHSAPLRSRELAGARQY